MLTIICGEDVISSRNYFVSLKKQYTAKGYEVKNIRADDIADIARWLADSPSLFFQKRVFFTENLNKKINRTDKNRLLVLESISKMADAELIDWENLALRELRFAKLGKTKEFKPNQSIFKLLDSLYPTNKQNFISLLERLTNDLDETFIFIMLTRYVRNLILIKEGIDPAKMQPWQIYKFKSQAKFWKIENLINFYQALFKIDLGLKTSSNPFSIKESLAILACHFL